METSLVTSLDIDNVNIDGNTITTQSGDLNLNLQMSNIVDVQELLKLMH